MATIREVEQLALALPKSQRALLAAHLLGSLSPVLYEDDEGIAEALAWDGELDNDPASGMSLDELDAYVMSRRSPP